MSLSSFDFFAIILETTELERTAKIGGREWKNHIKFNIERVRFLCLELSVKRPHKMNWRVIRSQRDSCLRPTI
jgi:hypothetical protein